MRLRSLVSSASLNGETGRLLEFVDATGRWAVQLGTSKKQLYSSLPTSKKWMNIALPAEALSVSLA